MAALYAALDAERNRLGVSWRQVASEIGVSPATLARAKQGGRMETDGVLGMVRWVGCPIEAFSETNRHLAGTQTELGAGVGGVLRLNTGSLHRAVDDERRSRGMSWRSLADHLNVGASQLTHLSKGGRVGVHFLLTLLSWLGRNAESYTHITDH